MIPPVPVPRRTLLGALGAFPAAGVLAACGGDQPDAENSGTPDRVTHLTNFLQFGRNAHSYVAQKLGIFADNGLDVAIEPGTGTTGNLNAITAGQATFAEVDMAGAILSHDAFTSDGQDGFVVLAAVQQLPLAAVMTLAGNGIEVAADLEGATVAFPDGTVTELLFPLYMAQAGVTAGKVNMVKLEGPALAAALGTDQVDAIGQFVVGRPSVEAAADGRDVIVLPYDEYLPDLYGVVLLTSTKTAREQPDLCIRFRDALLGGLRAALDDPQAAGAAINEAVPDTPADVAAAEMALMIPYAEVPAGLELGDLDRARVSRNITLLQGASMIGPGMTPEDLVAWDLTVRPDQAP